MKKTFTPGKDRIEYGGAMIGQREVEAIVKVISSQGGRRWTVGPESVKFEKELAKTTGVKRAVVVNSGSSALLISMTALHLPKGSKVIIPALTFPTAFNAILQCGLMPVVIDCDPTLNISYVELRKAIVKYPDIKAVIAIDIAGNPVNLPFLRGIVGNDVKIILDDCDGYGTTLKGKFIEKYADLACVSFHAAHIITTGEGGAVLTNDEELANRVLKLREWGRASGTDKIYQYPGFPDDYKERYVYEEIGFNMKPLELQCAMGRIQLRKLPMFKRLRKANHDRLVKIFKKYEQQFIVVEQDAEEAEPCWFSFALMCNGLPRKFVMEELEKANIETRTIFSGNILLHPAYQGQKVIKVGDLHNANLVMERGLFLSCHPSLTAAQFKYIESVVDAIAHTQL